MGMPSVQILLSISQDPTLRAPPLVVAVYMSQAAAGQGDSGSHTRGTHTPPPSSPLHTTHHYDGRFSAQHPGQAFLGDVGAHREWWGDVGPEIRAGRGDVGRPRAHVSGGGGAGRVFLPSQSCFRACGIVLADSGYHFTDDLDFPGCLLAVWKCSCRFSVPADWEAFSFSNNTDWCFVVVGLRYAPPPSKVLIEGGNFQQL